MAKDGTPPRRLRWVNPVIIALNRLGVVVEKGAVLAVPQGAKVMRDAGVVPDMSEESFARLAGRCAVFRVTDAAQERGETAG